MKLLLHCCCAPCSVSCTGSLRAENIIPHLFWYNPNIHPYTEYKSRRDCLKEFAKNENLNLMLIDEYGLRIFLGEVFSEAKNPSVSYPDRCKLCYRIRLKKTASFAAQEGYTAFSTTLLISPYQDHEALKLTGEEMSEKYGVEFLYRDFRPLFREGQSKARAANLYMQKYCGCVFSEEERYLSKTHGQKRDEERYLSKTHGQKCDEEVPNG
jgi:predicted adenine nucleotide alpha hydrolase (AANH) superfamily ATPase